MKRLIFAVIISIFCVFGAKAQLTDGYYHIKNAATGRYISINDTDPGNYKATQAGDVNMG